MTPECLKLCQNIGVGIDALYFLTKKTTNSFYKNCADVENVLGETIGPSIFTFSSIYYQEKNDLVSDLVFHKGKSREL